MGNNTKSCLVLLLGIWEYALISSSALDWPQGLYGLPKPIQGCPQSSTITWKTGVLFQDCENTNPQTSCSPSYHLAGFVTTDVQREFCIKDDATTDAYNPPWPDGQYCVYQGGDTCPPGMESGWVVWDDEHESNVSRTRNGTLPVGTYETTTKIHFCCNTRGSKQTAISLPLSSPFYLIAYGSSSCQMVRGATATREFIYYETEYNTLSTKNDYGGTHPYRVTRSRYGHTIYYCYYNPNYCPPLTHFTHGSVFPYRCARAQSNAFNDTCYARCDQGYVPRDGGVVPRDGGIVSARCLENGAWSNTLNLTCIPEPTHVPHTTSSTPPSTPKHPTLSSNNSETNTDIIGPSQNAIPMTSQNTIATDTSAKPTSTVLNRVANQSARMRSRERPKSSMRSRARLVAGVISAGIVCLGVVALFGIRIFKAIIRGKENRKPSKTDNSKSLEEILRIVLPRTVSEGNLMRCSQSDRSSYPIDCPVKTDQNPLYDSVDEAPPRTQIRMSNNVLYESVFLRPESGSSQSTADGIPYIVMRDTK